MRVPRQALVSFSKIPHSTLTPTGSLFTAFPVPGPAAAIPPPLCSPHGGGPLYIQARGTPGQGNFPPSPLQKELEGTGDVHAMPNSRHAQVNEIFLSEGRQMRSIDFVVQESIAVFPQLQVL